MTTTELIKLLKSVEHDSNGRAREISFHIGKRYLYQPYINLCSTGTGGVSFILEKSE